MSKGVLSTAFWIGKRLMRAEEYFDLLLAEAKDAYRYGVSHRGFYVGAAALFRRRTAGGQFEYAIFAEANNKPLPKGGPRKCAEDYLIERAEKEGFDSILWFVIFAPPQIDDTAPHYLVADPDHEYNKTLKNCGYCRTQFNDLLLRHHRHRPRLLTRHTLVTSVNIFTGQRHTFKVGWLLRHYGVPNMRWPRWPRL